MRPEYGTEKKDGYPKIQKIAFLSSVSLEVLAGIYGLMNPCVAAFGAVAAAPIAAAVSDYLGKNNSSDPAKQYYTAMNDALENTRQHFVSSHSMRELIDELSEMEVEFDVSLENLIDKTETYQSQYMIKTEVRMILDIFEKNLEFEVSKYDALSRYKLQRGSKTILEKLKMAHLVLEINGEKLDQVLELTMPLRDGLDRIDGNVSHIREDMTKVERLLRNGLQFLQNTVDLLEKSIVTTFIFIIFGNIFLVGSNDNQLVNIWLIMLLSEGLLKVPRHNVLNWKKFIYVTLIQTFMITVGCSAVMPIDYLEMTKVALLGFVGVLVKNFLIVMAESDD